MNRRKNYTLCKTARNRANILNPRKLFILTQGAFKQVYKFRIIPRNLKFLNKKA